MAPDTPSDTGGEFTRDTRDDSRGTGGDSRDTGGDSRGTGGDSRGTGGESRNRPPLRLVRGDASPEEVAALLAVLSATSAGPAEPPTRHTSRWSSPGRAVRRPVTPGPGAWQASAWPH